MDLVGELTAISIADLIYLLHTSEWEGTVRVEREGKEAFFVLQGGLILFPLRKPPQLSGRRSRDRTRDLREREERRGNKHMVEACTWAQGRFRCYPDKLPRGFVARRTLVVKVERLRKYCSLPKRGVGWGWESGVGLKGQLPGKALRTLISILAGSHSSGVLEVKSASAEFEVLVHCRTPYLRRSASCWSPLKLDPAKPIHFHWKPQPVPEVGMRPERFQRATISGRHKLQVA